MVEMLLKHGDVAIWRFYETDNAEFEYEKYCKDAATATESMDIDYTYGIQGYTAPFADL